MNGMQKKTGSCLATAKRSEDGTVRIDGYTRFCLSAIMVLLAVLIVGLWAEGPIRSVPDASGAGAAGPRSSGTTTLLDARAQRLATLNATQETNRKLDKIIDLLKSGNIRVSIVEPGKEKKGPGNVRKPPNK